MNAASDLLRDVFAVLRPCRHLMSVVAYIDESADARREKAFALAGFVAHEAFWQEFVVRMKSRLQQDGIEVFHMTDCESCWGEFRKWQDDKAKSTALITDLVGLILDSQLVGVWSGAPLEDYNRIIKGKIHPILDTPYLACFSHLLHHLLGPMRKAPPEEKLGFVFEDNAQADYPVLAALKAMREVPFLIPDESDRLRIGPAAFVAKKDSVALQAADLLAYECFKHVFNRRFNPHILPRKSMVRLKSKIIYSFALEAPILEGFAIEAKAFLDGLQNVFPERDLGRYGTIQA